jgi:hypothetical protein
MAAWQSKRAGGLGYRRSMKVLMVLAALLGLGLAACSSDNGDKTPTPQSTSPAATSTRPPGTAVPGTTATVPPVDGTVDPLGFGSTDPVHVKSNPDPIGGVTVLKDVRVGGHPEQGGWDRVVFEFDGGLPEADVEYKPAASILSCGPGQPVPVQGQAILAVRLFPSDSHNQQGQLTIKSQDIAGPGNEVLQVKQYCDFEAVNQWAIGARAMQRFKVTTLQNPTRLVIDIKWP